MLDTILSWTSLPNLHPIAVHFPIALLPLALLLDLIALAWARQEWLGRAAGIVYGVAGVAALVAVELGEKAVDSLRSVPPEVQPHISQHSDWGHAVAWAIGGLAVLRVGMLFWKKAESHLAPRVAVLVLGLGVLAVLVRAADLGGGLVYTHGLGVATRSGPAEPSSDVDTPVSTAGDDAEGAAPDDSLKGVLEKREGGGFEWRPAPGDRQALGTVLRPAEGSSPGSVSVVQGDGPGLTLEVHGRSLLVFDGSFGDVQLDADLVLASFDGAIALAHHVVDEQNHRLFRVETKSSTVVLATVTNGEEKALDRESTTVPAEATLSVSVAGRHLKGMVDGATVAHGHEPAPEAGGVGLLLEGEGRVVIRSVLLTVL